MSIRLNNHRIEEHLFLNNMGILNLLLFKIGNFLSFYKEFRDIFMGYKNRFLYISYILLIITPKFINFLFEKMFACFYSIF